MSWVLESEVASQSRDAGPIARMSKVVYIFRAQTLGLALQRKTKKKKKNLEEIDFGICVLTLADFLPAPLLVPDNQTTLLPTSSGLNKDIVQFRRRINHCRTNMSPALSVFLKGCQHLSKKRWRYRSDHRPSSQSSASSHGICATWAVCISEWRVTTGIAYPMRELALR